MTGKERIYSYDFMRVMSILAVIMIHSIAFVVLRDFVMASKTWLVADIIDSFCRWCVPVFVMLSGALLIKKDIGNIKIFFRSKVNRIVWPFLFWVFIYILWFAIFQSNNPWWVDLAHGLRQFIVGHPVGPHLYFIQIIIGLYAVTPLISGIVSKFDIRVITRFTITIVFVSSISWYISRNITHSDGINMITRFIPYIGYYMLGYVMGYYREELLKFFRGWLLAALYITLGSMIAFGTLCLSLKNGSRFDGALYDYLSPLVVCMSAIVFIGLQKLSDFIDNQKLFEILMSVDYKKTISSLSSMVFGVYFIHYVLLDMFWQGYADMKTSQNGVVAAAAAFVVIILASFTITNLYRLVRHKVLRLLE